MSYRIRHTNHRDVAVPQNCQPIKLHIRDISSMILSVYFEVYGQDNTIKVMPIHMVDKQLTSIFASN